MEFKTPLFKINRMLGGYSLAVRDDWNYHIISTHITDEDKELYLKMFGEKLITYDEFYEWWCKIHMVGKYAQIRMPLMQTR